MRVAHDLYGMVLPTKYVLTLAAWDHMHIDIEWFVIFLENTRQDPVILNLNESIALPEDAPTGSDIFQVSFFIDNIFSIEIFLYFVLHCKGLPAKNSDFAQRFS